MKEPDRTAREYPILGSHLDPEEAVGRPHRVSVVIEIGFDIDNHNNRRLD
jgi:hypothetical protein